jgi:hypothetical protein
MWLQSLNMQANSRIEAKCSWQVEKPFLCPSKENIELKDDQFFQCKTDRKIQRPASGSKIVDETMVPEIENSAFCKKHIPLFRIHRWLAHQAHLYGN